MRVKGAVIALQGQIGNNACVWDVSGFFGGSGLFLYYTLKYTYVFFFWT